MDKIKYKNEIYNIADIINFEGTYHLIIIKDDEVHYINKNGNNYFAPLEDLTVKSIEMDYLVYLRKQNVLKMLITYIKENEFYANIKDVTAYFKEYIKTSLIETFLYWPYMSEKEAIKQLEIIKKDLEDFMNEKLHNRMLAPDNETIIIIDNYVAPTKFLPEEEFIKDPSFKK